jgi:adenylylsulfate kinase
MGRLVKVFDGDNVRQRVCRDLSFSPYHEGGRAENLRRISEMIRLFLDVGIICLTAFITSLRTGRNKAREMTNFVRFIEMYVAAENGCRCTENACCGCT